MKIVLDFKMGQSPDQYQLCETHVSNYGSCEVSRLDKNQDGAACGGHLWWPSNLENYNKNVYLILVMFCGDTTIVKCLTDAQKYGDSNNSVGLRSVGPGYSIAII